LFGIPTYPDTLARLHTFEPTDLGLIDARREERNRLGFAIQLALVRHPGPTQAQVATQPGLDLEPLVGFIARQLDLSAAALTDYAAREQTSTDRRLTLIACRLYRQAEQAARAERLQLSEVIPTRSGKGVGLVIPSLLTWPGSAIVHDIKGENWQLTAGFRARHGRVLLFDPTNAKSSAYNPLLEVRRGEWEVRDVQNIADILVDPEGSLEKRNHWEKTSHALLVGAILHVLYAEEDKTLAGVAAFLSHPKRPIESTLSAMMRTAHLGEAGVHPVVASAARELLNKSGNERSGVLSTAMSFLGLYRDPVVAEVTRRCDWRIGDIVAGDRPTTLYLVVPPSDINRTKPLIRLILNQIGRRLTEDLQAKAGRRRLLLMLDEFPALGRLDFFESALAFMAGYGIKSFLIAQSLNQIEKAYGPNNSILDNCHVRVSFATNDERTAKRVSDALGTATEMKAMKNYAGSRLSPWLGHLMVSRSETARPLLTPGEVMQLPRPTRSSWCRESIPSARRRPAITKTRDFRSASCRRLRRRGSRKHGPTTGLPVHCRRAHQRRSDWTANRSTRKIQNTQIAGGNPNSVKGSSRRMRRSRTNLHSMKSTSPTKTPHGSAE
jgi:hypothetical protein